MDQSKQAQLEPVPLGQVHITGGFWGARQEINRRVTLPIEYEQCRKTGRIAAFKLDWRPGKPHQPHYFWDSDVAKWLEAAAYSLATCPNQQLAKRVDAVIDLIARAQQPDGYLNVYFTIVAPERRWTNLRDCHELYCAGHLIEAAVAYAQATGKRRFLDVMCRYADYIGQVFGPRRGQKRGYPGHEEIELALVKLHRATGQQRYLDLARFFIEQRGTKPHYFRKEAKLRGDDERQSESRVRSRHDPRPYSVYQAHLPVREQDTVVGHAVRAMYLYCGMADVAAATGDTTLADACRRLWRDLTGKRMYVTGGIGSTSDHEGFTGEYDLPNTDAYAETCAAIGLIFWAQRMLQLDPDAGYADAIERALYNGVLSGLALDGKRFFYVNPLADDGSHRRQEWFGCACCPPNIARLIAGVGQYFYSQSRDTAWVHQYGSSRAELTVGGQRVVLEQSTQYPWRETVRLLVRPEAPATFTIALRIPGWCDGAELEVGGKRVMLSRTTQRGYALLERRWAEGDRVELHLPMPVQRVTAHPRCTADLGKVALQRGPVVYCVEEVDNDADLDMLLLPADLPLTARFDRALLGGVTVITGSARRRDPADWRPDVLYESDQPRTRPARIKAIPYGCWANRAPGAMRVWLNTC